MSGRSTGLMIHSLPGRSRVFLPEVLGNLQLAQTLEGFIRQLPGILDVRAEAVTGRVLICFDTQSISWPMLQGAIATHLETISQVAATAELPSSDEAPPRQEDWHALPVLKLVELLSSHDKIGISEAEAAERLVSQGKNAVPEPIVPSWPEIFMRQFLNFTTLTMVSIAALPVFLGRFRDTGGILFILALNAVIGTYQQQKAQRDIRSLRQMGTFRARVVRSGREMAIPAENLVPGDIILIEAGDRIPSDAALLECWNLEVDESSLTGESVPVAKAATAICDADTPLAERKNMLFMGTLATRGRARAIVVATGVHTEIGKLIDSLQRVQTRPTPLQKKLTVVARTIVVVALSIASVVVTLRLLQGYLWTEALLTGVSVATTAISEGLPIMITVGLVAGMRRMASHKAIVKEMSALETLAKVDVICTDKTGTLTKNEMTVKSINTGEGTWEVTGDGYGIEGDLRNHGDEVVLPRDHPVVWLCQVASLCNDADLCPDQAPASNPSASIKGDPTEAALLVAAVKVGVDLTELREDWQRIREIPFDSERRRMTVVCRNSDGQYLVAVKGSIDVVLAACTEMLGEQGPTSLETHSRMLILDEELNHASRALRVLGVAYKVYEEDPLGFSDEELESNLVWCGMFGMKDPPREPVSASIKACQDAGLGVVMITGDHPVTARAIGEELAILRHDEAVLTGQQVAGMSDVELISAIETARVFSRVSPIDKQRIVQTMQTRGWNVAMIGDGVNDAPALKQADVGIAVGSGADAAKESAAMVLTDGDFTVLVKAIRQGRSVLGNVRSTIGYVFLGNLSEVLYAALTVISGLPLLLMPMQMMAMNLLTDSLPILLMTIGHPATHRDQPVQAPLPSTRDVFDEKMITRVLATGLIVGLSTAAVFFSARAITGQVALAGTMALATLALGKLNQVPYWRQNAVDSEKPHMDSLMKVILGLGVIGLLAAIYIPSLSFIFNSVPLGLSHWAAVLGVVFAGRVLISPFAASLESLINQRRVAVKGAPFSGAMWPAAS